MDERLPSVSNNNSSSVDGIPSDFPRSVPLGAVGGAQPKILVIEEDGKFYAPGMSPSALRNRFEICEDLVRQFASKSIESKAGKRSHLSETDILLQYRTRLIATKWTSIEEACWIINAVAKTIGWTLIE